MSSSNLTVLPGGGNKNELRESVRKLEEMLPDMYKFHAIQAQIKFNAYQEYVKQGFTPQQALELVKPL